MGLLRDNTVWREVNRLETDIPVSKSYTPVMAVSDIRAMLSGGHTLYVFDVTASHSVHAAGTVAVEEQFCFLACTRLKEKTLVAFAHCSSVSLHRLASSLPLRLEKLTSIGLTGPQQLLFRGDELLVVDWNGATHSHAIVSLPLHASGGALSEQRVLLDERSLLSQRFWALTSDQLIISDTRSSELSLFSFH